MCIFTRPDAPGDGVFTDLLNRYTQQQAVTPVNAYPGLGAPQTGPSPQSSARRKLWDFAPAAACPVTGVCLQWRDLHRLCTRAGLPVKDMTEYEVHVMATSECRRRSVLAELVQRELDARHRLVIQKAQAFKSDAELASWWDESIRDSNWAGVFWALMTHPRCTGALESVVIGQVHMLQHQVGMASRVDMDKLNDVLLQNEALAEERQTLQHRLQAQSVEHAQQTGQLKAELASLRADLIRLQAERDQACAQWAALQATAADRIAHLEVAQAHADLLDDNRRLRRLLERRQPEPEQAPPPMPRSTALQPAAPPCATWCATGCEGISNRSVLCVGGRTGAIASYRELIESQGARFVHHDGGDEERHDRLMPQLQAADVVICQVACISHNAYWRVKEHCKRMGKPCLFLESASKSSLERALQHLSVPEQASASA